MISKELAYSVIEHLVNRFDEQLASYKKADYNEAQTRKDFIDPFFKALGWDMDNSQGHAEAYREVINEDRVKVGSATKAPDYSFKLPGGKRLFFVEAKKPSVVVKDEVLPAYQVRRYAWSAKMPISILTDFEELAIYDCNKKPNATDKASAGRIKYLTYKSYLSEFDFIWETFSKQSVLKGSFDKFVAADKNKKGTATVDAAFLASLDEWRKELAQNIALRNTALNEDELNFVVQQTLDRIIFLRIAEDRGVEEYGRMQKLMTNSPASKLSESGRPLPPGGGRVGARAGGENYYQNLFSYFQEADSKYNSGLFDFKKDNLSRNLLIDNKTIKGIIAELYYPISPYEFSVLSVEILGSAYEQFLGKQIKLTAGHRAIIEEKPEVRKAGGVYYTPQYIVEYIVENTVGKLAPPPPESKIPQGGRGVPTTLTKQTEDKTERKIVTPEDVAKLKIVDPACGSGSFLLGAYQYLMSWHLAYYSPAFAEHTAIAQNNKDYNEKERNEAIKQRNKLPLTPSGNLSTALKKQILLNNIYGVDIDTQAVEVTKLSLLLKCMEGETGSSINAEMRFGERLLPTLDSNIKSGNSLIDLDFYDGQLDFEPAAEKKIKPFSWEQAFAPVFKQGGFDAVIGNPPYVRQELLGDFKNYFQRTYKVYHGVADLYSYFFEKGMGLLSPKGLFGIIVANKWMRANYGEPLRKWLKDQPIKQIIDFGDLPVFQTATTYPCIFIAGKEKTKNAIEVTNVKTLDFSNLTEYITAHKTESNQISLEDGGWNLGTEVEQELLKKLQNTGISLGEYVKGKIYYGIKTGLNEAFVIDEETKNKLIKEDKKSAEIIKPFLGGRDIKRYATPNISKFLIFTKRGIAIENYPAIKKHLLQFKKQLTPKPKGWAGTKWEGRAPGNYEWYELQASPENTDRFDNVKIMYPDIALRTQAIYDTTGLYSVNTVYMIESDDKFLLAILNSNLFLFYFSKISNSIRGGYFRFFSQYIETVPIPVKTNKNLKDDIIKLVETMVQLQKDKQAATLPAQQQQLEQRIAYTDKKINEKIYEVYGLGEEERRIVEGRMI